MERRIFLKSISSLGLFTLIAPKGVLGLSKTTVGKPLSEGFRMPPDVSKPYTWWHWMNGNMGKEGITLDLEAMKEVGLGGFQLFDAGTGIVKGPIEYLSEEWKDLMRHTVSESKRLGLEFAMHNCPGWSSSGGPWITPEMSMQQLTWSLVHIKGGIAKEIRIPVPPSHLGYYRDARIVAYPHTSTHKKFLSPPIVRISSSTGSLSTDALLNLGKEPILMQSNADGEQAFLLFEFEEQTDLSAIQLFTGSFDQGGLLRVEGSDDGLSFYPLGHVQGGSANYDNEGCMPASLVFSKRTLKFIRLLSSNKRYIQSIDFLEWAIMPDWLDRANFRNGGGNISQDQDLQYDIIDPNVVIDLTANFSEEGVLLCDIPEGNWTILRLGHTSIGKLNHSAPTTGTGLECDKYSAEAFRFHFDKMFSGGLLDELKKMTAENTVGMLIDSYEMGRQNWTKNMLDEFEKRRSYSMVPFLPALIGAVVGSNRLTDQFLWDFRTTCAELMADNYHGEFARICKKYNIVSYTEPYGGGPFDEMDVGAQVDSPMGEFWAGNTVLWENSGMVRTAKLAASIAHLKNQPIVGAEAFTAEPGAGKWQQYPYSMKALGDWMYTEGITRFVFHRYAHQPHPTAAPGMTMGPWGIHFERTNTWWKMGKAWLQYLARVQFLLQKGRFVADLAYLTDINPGTTQASMKHQLNPAPPTGFDYDLISASALATAKIENGRLSLPGGAEYSILVITDKKMSMDTLLKICSFIDQGLTIVGRPLPEIPGLKNYEANQLRARKLFEKYWSFDEGKRKYAVYEKEEIDTAIQYCKLVADFYYSSSSNDAAINFIHRRDGDLDIYFLANRRRRPEHIMASFRVVNAAPSLWDPDTGSSYPLALFSGENGVTTIPLLFEPAGSMFIVFGPKQTVKTYKSITYNGISIASTKHYPAVTRGMHAYVFNDFCLALWAKPEVDIPLHDEQFFGDRKADFFAVYPVSGAELYGEGHATMGLLIGRNGLVIFERETADIRMVLSVPYQLSGWTYVVVKYNKALPALYVNGKLLASGIRSTKIVHPSLGESLQSIGASYFNGDMSEPYLMDETVSEEEILAIYKKGYRPQDCSSDWSFLPHTHAFALRKNGNYRFSLVDGTEEKITIDNLPKRMDLNEDWMVHFPVNSGAPSQVKMPKLESLHRHDVFGVKYFSGTAVYKKTFSYHTDIDRKTQRLFLNLGKVAVIAEVWLNGQHLGILWKPPYSIDVTQTIVAGSNQLTIHVANLWVNRLIGDEQLPPEDDFHVSDWSGKFKILADGAINKLPDWYVKGIDKPPGGRIAFCTWKHYQKDSPLVEAGLIGPVYLESYAVYPIINI